MKNGEGSRMKADAGWLFAGIRVKYTGGTT